MPRPRKYASDAERIAAYRARHELVTLSVDVPAEIVAGIEEYMRFKKPHESRSNYEAGEKPAPTQTLNQKSNGAVQLSQSTRCTAVYMVESQK